MKSWINPLTKVYSDDTTNEVLTGITQDGGRLANGLKGLILVLEYSTLTPCAYEQTEKLSTPPSPFCLWWHGK